MTTLIVARSQDLVHAVVATLSADGFAAHGVTADAEAVARLESGEVTTAVIGGGVAQDSREMLKNIAQTRGVPVIDGAMRGRPVEDYVRRELEPRLSPGA
ncbi:MAG TPA: hypothetical protein VHC18_21560 [Amycolatopsis sp.]|nr:hypothetical protein [Amycolatopsis sp.]